MLDAPPFPVRTHLGLHGHAWRRAPSGFSGAVVWIGDGPRPVAVKMWPANVPAERVRQIHAWMHAARRLPFVPAVYGLAEHAGRVWDGCAFLSGTPRERPTADDVRSACAAVAYLHNEWAETEPRRGPCPGVRNRLHILGENESLLRAGPHALPAVHPLLDPLLRRTTVVAARLAPLAVSALRAWENREFGLHVCVRDLRGEHILFVEQSVTGIIDYGAAGFDHAATDLARLLGDYTETDVELFAAGLDAYRRARLAFDAPDEFVRLLADSGAVCSLLGWLFRLAVRREPFSDAGAIASRLARMCTRAERIARF